MINKVLKEHCSGCEACYNICPANAITMQPDEEGFYYPAVDFKSCISCGRCDEVCPSCHAVIEKNEILSAVACYAKDYELRARSTSGGIFSVISNHIINNLDGIVYGVKFDENFDTIYDKAEKQEEIRAFCGSKYVQCRVGKTYASVKRNLESGRYVLFSGLPCHIEALVRFLSKNYEKLYLLDMVCFGIASPCIWQSYLTANHDKGKLKQVVFKDKKEGWKHWKIKYVEGDKEIFLERTDDFYMNSYLQRMNIRPSCFKCGWKGLERKSDFTLADCWGEGEKNQRLNDDKGLSALLIHTNKGKRVFEEIKEQLHYEEYDEGVLMAGNWAAYCAPQANENRRAFFDEYR